MGSRNSSDSHGQERHYPRSLIGGRASWFQIQKLVEEVEKDYKLPIAFIGGSLQKMKEALEKRQQQAKIVE